MLSGAFLEKPVFHFRPSEASFIISLVATGDMSPVATGDMSPVPTGSMSQKRATAPMSLGCGGGWLGGGGGYLPPLYILQLVLYFIERVMWEALCRGECVWGAL